MANGASSGVSAPMPATTGASSVPLGTMGISSSALQGMSGASPSIPASSAVPSGMPTAASSSGAAPQQSSFSQWLTGKQVSPQEMSSFISNPQNKDLLNSYTMLNMTGHQQAANQLMQGTPLAQNTGGALGSLSRVLTGQTNDPVEGLLHLGLAGGLDLIRMNQARQFLKGEPNMMNNMSNQMLQAQQQQAANAFRG